MRNTMLQRFFTAATAGSLAVVISTGCTSQTPSESAQQPSASAPAPSSPPAASPTGTAALVEREGPTASSSPSVSAPALAPPRTSDARSGSTAKPSSSATTVGTPAAADPAPPAPPPPAPTPPPPPRTFTLATGRPITVYTTTTLSTRDNQPGERFSATLAEPIVDGDWVIAKKGAHVEGVITDADPGKRVKGVASIAVRLDSLTLADGDTVKLTTSTFRRQAKSTKGKDAKKIGIGAGVGAAIGAIAGGGKGAAIGAGVGGGAGTGAVLATRGDPAVIPAETSVRVTLRAPVTVSER